MKKRFTKVLLLCLMISILTSIVSASYPCPTGECSGRIFERQEGLVLVKEEYAPCREGLQSFFDKKLTYNYVYVWRCTECSWTERDESKYACTVFICEHGN